MIARPFDVDVEHLLIRVHDVIQQLLSLRREGNHPGGSNSAILIMMPQGCSVLSIFLHSKMTTSQQTGPFHVFEDFHRHSPENVTSSHDPLETLSAVFEVPTSYFGNLKWYIVKLVQILVCVNIFS